MLSTKTFDCLRDAIRIAKAKKLSRVAPLRLELERKGYNREIVTEALTHWARHENRGIPL